MPATPRAAAALSAALAAAAILAPGTLEEMSANARASVADKTWPALCDQLLGYYQEVIDGYPKKGRRPLRR